MTMKSRRTVRPDGERVGGFSVGEIEEQNGQFYDGQPMVVRCAACDWTHEGPAGEGRVLAEQHRKAEHPELAPLSRREREERARVRREEEAAARAELARARDALQAADDGAIQPPPPPAAPPPPPPPPPPPAAPRARSAQPRWSRESALEAIRAWAERHGRPPSHNSVRGDRTVPSAPTLTSLFGSWSDAIEQAGFERPHRGTNYKPKKPARSAERVWCRSCGHEYRATRQTCPACQSPARSLEPPAGRPQHAPGPPAPPPVPTVIPPPVVLRRPLNAPALLRLADKFEAAGALARSYATLDYGPLDPDEFWTAIIDLLRDDVNRMLQDGP